MNISPPRIDPKASLDKTRAILEPDPEPGHARIGDRQLAVLGTLLEERNHAAARSDHIAVTHHRKARTISSRKMITRDKEFVGTQLGRAVEIDRVDRLVGRQRDDLFDPLIDARIDHVFRTDHVGLDALDRIVLGDRNLLERGSMDDDIDTCERTVEALAHRERRR